MAEINYDIFVDTAGNVTVTQDVVLLESNVPGGKDRVTFTARGRVDPGKVAAIKYGADSPFTGANDPKPNVVVAITGRAKKFNVDKANRGNAPLITVAGCSGATFPNRNAFPFACGQADPANLQTTFVPWVGGGATPSGGDDQG